jgi:hypothetical protein
MSGISRQDVVFDDSIMYEMLFTDLIKDNIHTHSVLQSRAAAAGLDKDYKYFQLHTVPLIPAAALLRDSRKRTFEPDAEKALGEFSLKIIADTRHV